MKKTLKKFYRYVFFKLFESFNSYFKISIKLQNDVGKSPRIGMALLVQDRPDYLKKSLFSLLQTDTSRYPLTVLLHDDGSTDPKVKAILDKAISNNIRFINFKKTTQSGSWGGAFNSAMKELQKHGPFEIIGTADSDAYFHPQWLNKTMDVAIYAKKNHRKNILGPFSSFNSSDYEFHNVIGKGVTPFGNFWIKERMGALNYFYFYEDFNKLGFFEEHRDDETKMTEKFKKMRVRNFSLEESYVEHIGEESILNLTRPVPVKNAVYALNPASSGWPDYSESFYE